MRNWLTASLLLLATSASHAQVYTCTVGGITAYQQVPCAGDLKKGQQATVNAVPGSAGSQSAAAPLPWPGLDFGMPVSEVLRRIPGSREDHGAVTLKGFVFSGKTFDVQFGFKSDRLAQVHLGDTVFMEPNAAVRQSFDRLVATLRRIYGEPASQSVEELSWGLRGEASWKRPGSEVKVTISPVTRDQSMILFNYFGRK